MIRVSPVTHRLCRQTSTPLLRGLPLEVGYHQLRPTMCRQRHVAVSDWPVQWWHQLGQRKWWTMTTQLKKDREDDHGCWNCSERLCAVQGRLLQNGGEYYLHLTNDALFNKILLCELHHIKLDLKCSRRRSTPLSGLSNAQLTDHYANCIKLSAENVSRRRIILDIFHLQIACDIAIEVIGLCYLLSLWWC